MTLASALSTALSGLQVATTQMQLTAGNIANAHTKGYTTKTATQTSVSLGNDSGGVTISGYARSTNTALSVAYNDATTLSSFYGQQNSYLQQVQAVLGSNSTNPPLSNALAQFQSAWTQFSSAPESPATQQTVIQSGVNLAGQVQTIAKGVTTLAAQVTGDIGTTVKTLNADLTKLSTLNAQISRAQGEGQPSGDLQDQRDQAVNDVASITGATVFSRPNGQVALYTPGGLLLVDSASAQSFTWDGTNVTAATGQTVTNDLTGGSLEAQINFLNGSATSPDPGTGVINKLNNQLKALTDALTTTTGSPATFASAYNTATTGTGELASGFFTIDVAGDPNSIAVNASLVSGSATVKTASATPVANALAATRSFSASSLSVPSGTYADLGTAILAGFQQAANTLTTQSTSAAQQQTFYQQSLSSATGVNVDNELVNLTTLQNSYAASAHVISTINSMLQALENVI
ncbi:MAG: flagellar hook-associated protein FlgK [Pseudomonadota bacterium]|nr:flagellar hook-associated protein FlgK [Pseudomonadota bacterium]